MITPRVVAASALVLLVAIASRAAEEGAVVSADARASSVGARVLRAGGNAADAAVATALALAVTFPQAGNLGGGGFAIARFGDTVVALDFRETAPAAATRDMYLGADGRPRHDASLIGPLAAGVPGAASGLFALHHRFGRLPWRSVVAPAIHIAEDGFVVPGRLARDLREHRSLLERFEETRGVFFRHGEPLQQGSTLRQPDLARTLKLLARSGPSAISKGRVAEAVQAASRAHGGVLTGEDLASCRPEWREPVIFAIGDWSVASMPLPSSGGAILGLTAGLLQRLGWKDLPRDGPGRAHLMVESFRTAYSARTLLGDPASTKATPAQLLDPGWLDAQALLIEASLPAARRSEDVAASPVDPGPRESTETTHLSVVDSDGGAVALTITLNGTFGCGLVVEGAGFLLNDEMDDFTVAAGQPNLYGLVQGEANAIAPGRRMLSSMSPTIAWRGADEIVLGSPGGSRIPTSTLQVLLDVIVDGDSLRQAVDRPRIHHQWMPDEVLAEHGALGADARAELARRGHVVRDVVPFGEVEAIRWSPDREVEAAADARSWPTPAAVVVRQSFPRHARRSVRHP